MDEDRTKEALKNAHKAIVEHIHPYTEVKVENIGKMDKDKITELFDELLKELGKHNYESENDVYVPDIRDDLIILNNKWKRYLGQEED